VTRSRATASWSKSIPVALWPKLDREAWEAALRPGDDIFEASGPASRWSPATRRKTQLGYGRFLFFLDQRGELDPDASPTIRVSRERLLDYLAELQHTNRGHTIQNRMQELGDAMRALAPGQDWRWILRAASRLRCSAIPAHDKRAKLRPIEELISQGLQLMEAAEREQGLSALARALQYRDGLIIAFLGFHPIRRRNLAALAMGQHVIEAGEQFVLHLAETKSGEPYETVVARRLTEPLRRYLGQHRPVLLSQRGRWYAPPGDALWISKHGSACSEDTFENVIRKRTGTEGRPALSPHLFRTCAATSIAVRAPQSVHAIPAILGHRSPKTHERYYTLAGSLEASRAYAQAISGLKRNFARRRRNHQP
jgi:integrase/recombinase XerD